MWPECSMQRNRLKMKMKHVNSPDTLYCTVTSPPKRPKKSWFERGNRHFINLPRVTEIVGVCIDRRRQKEQLPEAALETAHMLSHLQHVQTKWGWIVWKRTQREKGGGPAADITCKLYICAIKHPQCSQNWICNERFGCRERNAVQALESSCFSLCDCFKMNMLCGFVDVDAISQLTPIYSFICNGRTHESQTNSFWQRTSCPA